MKNQPNIRVPAGKWEKIFHFLALLLFLSLIAYIVLIYGSLPDQVPLHINVKGEVDDWGNKATILALPLIAVPMFMIMYFLGKFPHIHNYPVKVTGENAEQLYRQSRFMLALMNFEMMAMFTFIVWEFVHIAKGGSDLGEWLLVLTIVPILITPIYFIIRMRRFKPKVESA